MSARVFSLLTALGVLINFSARLVLVTAFAELETATRSDVDLIKTTGETYHVLVDHPEELHRVRRQSGRQPIRIHAFYDTTVESLPSQRKDIVKTLVADAITYFQGTYSVDRLTSPVKLLRDCTNKQYWLDSSNLTRRTCVNSCAPTTKCGVVTVPEDHLASCYSCLLLRGKYKGACSNEGNSGPGVDTDLLLYVAANSTSDCAASASADRVAFAELCTQEGALDRPIAGYINICPGVLSTSTSLYPVQLGTVKHELYHVLSFAPRLYAYYRDASGAPRTPRKQNSHEPNEEITKTLYPDVVYTGLGVYAWSNTTIRVVNRMWQTAQGNQLRQDYFMVTPKVREFVRSHFNCPTLLGAELENQDGIATALTHWEKRAFENEGMCGTYTQHAVFSNLTLSLMEDTGWYDVDYSKAEPLLWGRNLGCDFAMKSCLSWMEAKQTSSSSVEPYCLNFAKSGREYFCNLDRDAVAICNLFQFSSALPPLYQYMTANTAPLVSAEARSRVGGAVKIADYCPFYQQFKVTSKTGVETRRSVCAFAANAPTENVGLEVYTSQSKCVEHPAGWRRGSISQTRYGAGCYQFYCKTPNSLAIDVGLARVDCTGRAGMIACISQVIGGQASSGSIKCPSYLDMCSVDGNFASPPPLDKIACPNSIACDAASNTENSTSVKFITADAVCPDMTSAGHPSLVPSIVLAVFTVTSLWLLH